MKINVIIRFYEELNDYVKKTSGQKQDLFVDTKIGIAVGELIEFLGPPCSVVDLILVNGESVNVGYRLQNNDRVSVYPVFERFNIASVSLLKNSPLRNLKFICDVHLGRLVKNLRMLGFDTLYKNDYDVNILIHLSNAHNRILLSRNKKLVLNKKITRRYLLKQTDPGDQVLEVLEFFDLNRNLRPLSRCLECNGVVQTVQRDAVKHRVDKFIFETNNAFTECKNCGKLYWKGSHYDSMMKWIHKTVD